MIVKRILIFVYLLSLYGCVDGGANQNTEEFDFLSLMVNFADNVILPTNEEFALDAQSFADENSTLSIYCNSIADAAESTLLAEAQQDYLSLVSKWQELEVMLVGPALENSASLRNRIYSFNAVSTSACAIDQAVVLAQDNGFDISTRSLSHRGLDALEYLLFNDDLTHNCPSQITETAEWNSLPENDRKRMRCEYAEEVIEDITSSAQQIVSGWLPGEENFRSRFIDQQQLEENLNALSDALFYLEIEVKDIKLGVPTGLNPDCGQLSCADEVEAIFSRHSLPNIRDNLLGFQRVFNGDQGIGFDDLITFSGFPEVTSKFQVNVSNALEQIEAIEQDLFLQVSAIDSEELANTCVNDAANPDTPGTFSVCTLHGMLKRITDDLKTDFVTIVNLDLPDRAQSDND